MGDTTLRRLRQIRDDERRVAVKKPERDRLIREAADQGYTQEQIANATGLSQSRVQEVITGDR